MRNRRSQHDAGGVMATFIKLTSYKTALVVNADAIEWARAPDESANEHHYRDGSLLQLRTARLHVEETPEQILALIAAASTGDPQ